MTESNTKFRTPQEEFWSGEFGDQYINRNTPELFLASNLALFSKILSRTSDIHSVIEFGSNIGLNLEAIQSLIPAADLNAVEINQTACQQLATRLPRVNIFEQSILDYPAEKQFDLALIKGVLIHINPDELSNVYGKLAASSSRYVIIAEYYNPVPVTINYRGHDDKLFKRDFAGEFLDQHPDFQLVDYGFVWHRDPHFPQDDTTWFLLQRK